MTIENTLTIGNDEYRIREASSNQFDLIAPDGSPLQAYKDFGSAATAAVHHADEQRAKAAEDAKPKLEKLLDALIRSAFEDGADHIMAVECASGGSYIEMADAHTAAAKERADLLAYLREGETDEFGLPTIPGVYRDAKGDEGWYLDHDGLWNSGANSVWVGSVRSWPDKAKLVEEATANGWLPLTRIED